MSRNQVIGAALALTLAACATTPVDDSNWKPPPLEPPPAGAVDEAIAWARRHAVPLESVDPGSGFADLQPLKARIGDARIIGFGEGMHDTHEFTTFRNRLFEFLVEEMGVTAIGIETGVTEAIAADDYVLGRSEASTAAFTSVFSWADEASQESRQLLDWMRAYNKRPTTRKPLRVYGLDLSGARSGEFPMAHLAPEAMLAYVDRVDPKRSVSLREVFDPLLPSFNSTSYRRLSRSARNALTGAIADTLGAFEREQVKWIAASSEFDYQRAYRQAVVTRQLDMSLRNSADSGDSVHAQRDSSMARNAVLALQELGPEGKLMVYSYIGHIRKGPTATYSYSMGLFLKALIGDQYFVIGSLFNQGNVGYAGTDEWPMELSDPTTLNAALRAGADRDLFFIDTREFPTTGPLADWVDRGQPLRHDHWEGRPRFSFDLLVYVDTIGPLNHLQP